MRAYQLMVLISAVAVPGTSTQRRQDAKQPVDVTIYLTGADLIPNSENRIAMSTMKWMFARIGIRMAAVNGQPKPSASPDGSVAILVVFTPDTSDGSHSEALAYALPYGEAGTKITVLWDRIHYLGGGSERESHLLAHVLAHEIGHVLKCTSGHAATGVMKAHWDAEDLDAMNKKALEFTAADAYLIREGLIRLKERNIR